MSSKKSSKGNKAKKKPSRKIILKKIRQGFKKRYQSAKKRPFLIKITLLLLAVSFLLFFYFLLKDVPNPNKLTKTPAPVSTQILDRNGQLLYEVYSDQKRTPVNLADLPQHVAQTTIAIEDQNFYKHHGLDLRGIIRALYKTLTKQRLEGGSTITQQLVKIAVLSDTRRTLARKAREAILALITEAIYSKDEILELYLNHAPYGGTTYGIESATQTYFNKSARDLTLAQSALLAGLPQSPTKFSPFGAYPELAIQRQHQVLDRMLQEGFANQEEVEKAKQEKLTFSPPATTIKAPHFALMVRDLLVERYGEEKVNLGGLRVTTSLDLSLQEYAQASLSAEIESLKRLRVSNGAALITRPNTGEILAMIGSKDYFDQENDGQVNITTAKRQPGSSIKPINYAVGLLRGWTASTMYLDFPTCFSVTNQKLYCPRNYDNTFRGPVQMRHALGNSYNIPAVKQLALNGVEAMIATASAMGIKGWTDPSQYGLSLTLGGGEVTMLEMATAFGTFANAGVTVPLNPILKIQTHTGEILEETPIEEIIDTVSVMPQNWNSFWETEKDEDITYCLGQNAPKEKTINLSLSLSFSKKDKDNQKEKEGQETKEPECIKTTLPEEVAYIISNILSDNGARTAAFGASSELVIPNKTVSVKTGTTNNLRDNWTIGFTPDFLVTTWVGNNDNTPMSYVASGVTGASPIWRQIMRYILKDEKDHAPTQPANIKSYQVCADTGLLANQENQCPTRSEIFIKGVLPPFQSSVSTRKQIWVRRHDKQPLQPNDDTVDLDLEEHSVLSDPLVKDFCLDCAYPVDEEGKITWPRTIINYSLFQLNPPHPKAFLPVLSTPTSNP